jgi:hypothetical protein
LIIGEGELARGVVAVKPLRAEGSQGEYTLSELPARIGEWVATEAASGRGV